MICVVLCTLMLVYIATILQLVSGFSKVQAFSDDADPQHFFSIVIPFRNEARHLPALLESIRLLDYPKDLFEVILIDDFSDDASVRIVYDWRMANGEFMVTLMENIHITGSPKKDAISRAIPIAQREWIVTTDADCILPKQWLRTINAFIVHQRPQMIAAPVSLMADNGFLRNFQQTEIATLQAATIGAFGMGVPFMCNGANFAYDKNFFRELNGFASNSHVAGGDDVFMLQQAVAYDRSKVGYLKSDRAIILTHAEVSWRDLFSQKVRWASKACAYRSIFAKDLGAIVLLGNFTILMSIINIGFQKFQNDHAAAAICLFGILFTLKFLVDYMLFRKGNLFLERLVTIPIFSSLIYPVFSLAVGCVAIFGGYSWKGRKYR